MRSALNIRPLVIGTGLVMAGLVAGAALASWASAPSQITIRDGDTLVSYVPDEVMSMTYATPSGMTTVQRSAPGARFEVLSTFADGKPAQRCTMSMDMERRLDKLTTLTARRSITLAQRASDFPVQLGVIDVRDAVIGEPSGPVLVFANKDRNAVAVILDGNAAEVTLTVDALCWLGAACEPMARSQVPGA